jgi:hypothetical protein
MAVAAAAEEEDDMLQPIVTGDFGREFPRPIVTGDWDNDSSTDCYRPQGREIWTDRDRRVGQGLLEPRQS